MILSWSLVEIFRYMFYVFGTIAGDSNKKTPYPLFWLRYSLFAVLYPTGIMGELTVFLAAARDPIFGAWFVGGPEAAFWIYARILPFVYLFGSPTMILNMVGNRKSSFKKRFARPPPPALGIVFPLDEKKLRSSTPVNKAILAAAVGAVNPAKAKRIEAAKGYRHTYVKYLIELVEEQCRSPEVCLKIAQAGLDKAYDAFEFIAADGTAVTLGEAMATKNTEKFFTGFIKGEGTAKAEGIEIPYKGKILKGQALREQVAKWVDYGTIEPSAEDAIVGCIDNPSWVDLSDKYFVLLGAGSAMGPLEVLLALGANVVAVDLDRSFIWQRLIGLAKKSTGTMTFPLKHDQATLKTDDDLYASAGCNLFTHTPMIRDWLMNLYPGKSFTVGSYAYLNGAAHVQVSIAMDAISRDLSEKRPGTSLAYLCTPTDLHLVPKEAWDASIANFKVYSKRLLCKHCDVSECFRSSFPSSKGRFHRC
jgi:Protein tyrosine phosphatase-like protein, PTPLA